LKNRREHNGHLGFLVRYWSSCELSAVAIEIPLKYGAVF